MVSDPSSAYHALLIIDRVPLATIVQIAVLARSLRDTDQTRAMVAPVILQQIVLNLSLLTAVMLGLHGFFTGLTTQKFGITIRTTDYELSNASGNGSKGASRGPLSKGLGSKSDNNGSRSEQERDDKLKLYEGKGRVPGFRPDLVDKHKASVKHEPRDQWGDRNSDGSQENIIRQTVTWEVSHDTPTFEDEEDRRSLPISHKNNR